MAAVASPRDVVGSESTASPPTHFLQETEPGREASVLCAVTFSLYRTIAISLLLE